MSSTLERLRRLQSLRPQRTSPEPLALPEVQSSVLPVAAAECDAPLDVLVPGEVIANGAGVCYLRTCAFPIQELRGPHPFGAVLGHSPAIFAPHFPHFGMAESYDYTQALFLDTETTGLGGGAGVYAFMVGVGTFERSESGDWSSETGNPQSPDLRSPLSGLQPSPSHFVVRQFFMRHPGEEGALLLALSELLDQHSMSVTFNGRSFDLPLLRTRFQQNQRIYGDLRGSGELLRPERPHLDLLHPARRLWRRRLQSCRLIHLEESILAVRRSEEDVPGHLIPQLYADFVQSGHAGAMRRVFYHNLEDILSMVALATHLSCILGTTDTLLLEREDWLALGRCLEEQQQWAGAEHAYRRAIDLIREPQAKAVAFNSLGRLLKRQSRWQEAADIWESWLTSVPGVDPTPYVELAKYYEWQQVDLDQAIMWTQWAIHTLRTAAAWQRPSGALPDLERRLARLERKRNL